MPWHADTLLQIAEVFRHREGKVTHRFQILFFSTKFLEHSSASDLTSRALFAYERSFAPTFNFTTGLHRLDFDHVENRVLYLALSRHIMCDCLICLFSVSIESDFLQRSQPARHSTNSF